ncbi:MAG: NYN domain-containing protein, partial [Gemmatimonadales bacterium]
MPQQQQQHVGTHTFHHAPNAALLIDFDNVTMGIRSDLQTELKNLLSSDIIKGKVSVQRAYADWRRYPQYIVPLAESSIDMIMAPAYGSAKKNATDIRLAIDALELVFVRPEIGTFILLSGDSDFSSLVIKLKEYGKYVIGVGIRESSSDLLVMNCDEYYSYNALAGLVKTSDEEVVKHDPWELVTEAIQRMKRNGDVMRADRLKQVMQQIDSSFDEKNVGKSKFSLFVTEAGKRGLLSLTKLENGQLEVDVPHTASDGSVPESSSVEMDFAPSTSAAAQPVAASDEAPDRARRNRRGGRGRDREPRAGRADAAPSSASAEAEALPEEVVVAPRVEAAPPKAAVPAASGIGSTGLRLTRDEAFALVTRSVAAVTKGDAAASASVVRSEARKLLGRDSESLSERNFLRILHDAHDADLVDLRRRGSDFEVAVAVAAAPVDRQLEAAATANAPVAAPAAPIQRGMGSRGIGRGPMGKNVMPAHLLNIGVVGGKPAASTPEKPAAPIAAEPLVLSIEEPKAAKPTAKSAKKRVGAKKVAAKAAPKESAAAPAASPTAKRPARGRKKPAA